MQMDLKDRLIRLIIFIILSFIIVKCFTGVNLTNGEQINIVMGVAICFMFVNTYYPQVVLK
jgi:Flp pilus assembly protein protease CpaA